jgi:hypothetical protein
MVEQEARSFIKDNHKELEEMIKRIKRDHAVQESKDFPFDADRSAIIDSIYGEEFARQYPNSYRAGFKGVSFYSSCLIMSDIRQYLATELLYCKNNNLLKPGKQKNGKYIRSQLEIGWYLLSDDDYILGYKNGFHYP